MKKLSKKMKLMIFLVAFVLSAGIIVVATMGSMGYFAYLSIDKVVKAPVRAEDDESITLMSANIRRQEKIFNFDKHDMGDHRWYKRAEYYLKNIEYVSPDIFGAQEVQRGQYEFLTEHLSGYGSVVTYRDKAEGARAESCPIFYSQARFELLSSGTFWLSEYPNRKYYKSWNATQCRITTYVILRDKKTEKKIAVFNAHTEWEVDQGRDQELQVLAEQIKLISAEKEVDKSILFGDLNTDKNTSDGAAALLPLETVAQLKDAKTFPGMKDYGNTFHGYGLDKAESLDYFYLPEDVTVLKLGKVDKRYDGVYPSDHYPIYVQVRL